MSIRKIIYMTKDEVLKIPEEHLPLAVLSSSAASILAFGIITVRKSIYNHFMWMHKPGFFASQGLFYSEVPAEKYLKFDNRLKFWYNPNWDQEQKFAIKNEINKWLNKPKFSTRYDWLAILGQALNIVWVQNPLTRICSDYGSILRESNVDLTYNLKNPAPDQVDEWFSRNLNYNVYGRYAGE